MNSRGQHHERRGADPQAAVRVGAFERALEGFNREIATKTALLLTEYHRRKVEPLQRRIEYLELPWYKKLLLWAKNRAFQLEPVLPPADLAPVPSEPPAA